MQRPGYAFDAGYPGMEKEQLEPNSGFPRNGAPLVSPMAGRQQKPGVLLSSKEPLGVLRPSGLHGWGAEPTTSASLFTDASAEPTMSALAQPADSCDPTVDGPALKRRKVDRSGAGSGFGLYQRGWTHGAAGCASSAAADSDSDDGEEVVVSRKRPTPGKAPASALAPAVAAHAAVCPPPTWGMAVAMQQQQQQAAPQAATATPTGTHISDSDSGDAHGEVQLAADSDSEMEDENFVTEWQRFPYPHPLDVEE